MPPLNLLLKSQAVEQVSEHRHLGVNIEDQIKGQAHINCVTNTVAKNVYLLSRLRHFFNAEACRTFFHAHITSGMNCVSNVRHRVECPRNMDRLRKHDLWYDDVK